MGSSIMQKAEGTTRLASPEQMLEEHRQTWHRFIHYAGLGAAGVAILLLAMRLFLV
jgi:hypothetical protein